MDSGGLGPSADLVGRLPLVLQLVGRLLLARTSKVANVGQRFAHVHGLGLG